MQRLAELNIVKPLNDPHKPLTGSTYLERGKNKCKFDYLRSDVHDRHEFGD